MTETSGNPTPNEATPKTETPEARLKRMRMRSWRRGTKEMDLVLGPFADAQLSTLDAPTLDLYDRLLGENDQDLYPWVSGMRQCPDVYKELLDRIGDFARTRHLKL